MYITWISIEGDKTLRYVLIPSTPRVSADLYHDYTEAKNRLPSNTNTAVIAAA